MVAQVVQLSERGQVTIPKEIREAFKVKTFSCDILHGRIVFTPMMTKEEFIRNIKKTKYKELDGEEICC